MTDELEKDFVAIERGEQPASPAAADQHKELVDALGSLGAEQTTDAAWMDAVLDSVDNPKVESIHKRRVHPAWFGLGVAVAVAAAILVLLLRPQDDDAGEPGGQGFSVSQLDGGPVVRGRELALGDTVRVRWPADEVLWVYFNDELLVACPGAESCVASENTPYADVVLDRPGRYSFVRVDVGAPTPQGVLDKDVAAALRSKFNARIEADLEVR